MSFWKAEMLRIATAEQMKELDRKTIEAYGLPGIVLMENAGRGAAEVILRTFPDILRKKVAVVAGKGNNGGDGFVIARYLLNKGVAVRVFLLTDPTALRGDAAANYSVFVRMKGEVVPMPSSRDYQKVRKDVEIFDLLVDAIFGTGLDAEITGYYREVIDHLNSLKKNVVAVDIPSGLDANTGRPLGAAVRASLTVTFGLPKVGHLISSGTGYVGDLQIVDIGIPEKAIQEEKIQTYLLQPEAIRGMISTPRKPDTHKGDYGHLLVIAGSPGKTGAAAMASEAALRTGAGLVTLAVPRSLNSILEVKLTEVMTEPVPETAKQTFSLRALEPLLRLCEGKSAVVIGPGIGTAKETQGLVLKLIQGVRLPMVIDADGLNALATDPKTLPLPNRSLVLTPHPGEMARLVGATSKAVQEDRIGVSRTLARTGRLHLVLKGHRSVIATPAGEIYINPTGNPGMASAGTGDVLTGMIGGLIAQGCGILSSLQVAVYLHGSAGDRAAVEKGERSLIATDLIEKIPLLFRGDF
jgi:ADP-dependent NAD(P)H-hydrate dehydratase / NAD(P)H-hydrate epimerase